MAKEAWRGDSHQYSLWVGNGQAVLGDFCPAGTVTNVPLIRLKIGPPDYPGNEINIYFWDEADMVTTAQTLRRITEALERTLRPEPEPEPDWDYVLALGVLGS